MTDEPFYTPNLKPAPAERRSLPGEAVFSFRTGDHAAWHVELRDQGAAGIDVQFFRDLEFDH